MAAQPLPERMLRDESLELRHELGVAAELEIGFDPLLEGGETHLLQAKPFTLGERMTFELSREGSPATC